MDVDGDAVRGQIDQVIGVEPVVVVDAYLVVDILQNEHYARRCVRRGHRHGADAAGAGLQLWTLATPLAPCGTR